VTRKLVVVSRGSVEPPSDADLKATFGLVKELEVTDRLTLYYMVRKAGAFRGVWAKIADTPPAGSDALLNIDSSDDDGETWTSIFDTGSPLTLPDGATDMTIKLTGFSPDNDTVAVGDLMRIGCTQVGSTTPGKGVQVVLWWA